MAEIGVSVRARLGGAEARCVGLDGMQTGVCLVDTVSYMHATVHGKWLSLTSYDDWDRNSSVYEQARSVVPMSGQRCLTVLFYQHDQQVCMVCHHWS